MRRRIVFVVLLILPFVTNAQYRLHIIPVDKDSAFFTAKLKVQTSFRNQSACISYVQKLPSLLTAKGYPAASVDSVRYDSAEATIQLFAGDPIKWAYLNTDSVDRKVLEAVSLQSKDFSQQRLDAQQLQLLQQKMLDYLENNGYPFASILLDSISWETDGLRAKLRVDKGPLYKIDSIRNHGPANISSNYLQHYLGIMNGATFRKDRLQAISRRIRELPFLQEQKPWDLTLLGTGSILNVYLAPKKAAR